MNADDARAAAERAARDSYGRLVAFLSARGGDVAAAEDALGDAFAAALAAWPSLGVPDNPEAWLMTAARRRLIDGARRAAIRADAVADIAMLIEEAGAAADEGGLPDDRLRLMLACAHPAIAPAARTPLMLQTVLGLDAARIASAFLVKPAAMGQRLSRAKAKIKLARVPFEVPNAREVRARLDDVLDAIYAAYGTGWDDAAGADARRRGLAEEALWLARVCARLAPEHPEAAGLLALLLHCEARRGARRSANGAYAPLSEQDPAQWNLDLIAEAETQLRAALARGAPGRFQLEAAIQSAHAWRRWSGRTDWAAVAALYDRLVELAPSLGAFVARAAAHGEAFTPAAGLARLEEIPLDRVAGYQPFWATRAHLLAGTGRAEEARADYERAMGLTEDEAVRAFLRRRADTIADARSRGG